MMKSVPVKLWGGFAEAGNMELQHMKGNTAPEPKHVESGQVTEESKERDAVTGMTDSAELKYATASTSRVLTRKL